MKRLPILLVAVAAALTLSASAVSLTAGPGDVLAIGEKGHQRGWLGVSVRDMTHRLAHTMDVKTEEGALINDVEDESPADKAGIKEDDIIVEFGGKKISDASELTREVKKTKPGSTVSVVVARNDEKKSLKVEIGERPETLLDIPCLPLPPHTLHLESFGTSTILGLRLHELSEQLGFYFQAPEGRGVLVEEVQKESAGEKAGFKAGDVITRVGTRTVEDIDDVRKAFRKYDEGDKVNIEIIRRGAKQTLPAIVDDIVAPLGHQFDRRMKDLYFKLEGIRPRLERLKIELEKSRGRIKEITLHSL